MRAGTLRHVVEFDQPVTSQSSSGDETVTFTYAFSMRASIEPLKGREQLIGEQINAELDTIIRLRWSPQSDTINAKWRCRHGGVIYNISSRPIHIKEGRRELLLPCKSGVNAG